jgi:hypothetical protein
VLDPIVMRLNKAALALDNKLAHNGAVTPLQDTDDLTIGSAVVFDSQNPRQHTVAMHRPRSGLRRNKKIALDAFNRTVRNNESVSVAMNSEDARSELTRHRSEYVTRPKFDQISALCQSAQQLLQLRFGGAFHPQFSH